MLGSGILCLITTMIQHHLNSLLLMAYFMSERLKEGLMCMRESDPFVYKKKTNPDTLMTSDEDCMLHCHDTQA